MQEEPAIYASRNRVEGSLAETPLRELLEPCRRHMVTGTIRIDSSEGSGVIQLRAGVIDHATFGMLVGDAAVIRMSLLRAGAYHVEQRAPDLSGRLAAAAALEGHVAQVPLSRVMRHCEENRLTCSIQVVSGFERGELRYVGGDLCDVLLDDVLDHDAIATILRWHDARYRVVLEPLAPEIAGWPKVGRAPTVPAPLSPLRSSAVLPAASAPVGTPESQPPARRIARGTGPVPLGRVAPRAGTAPMPPALVMPSPRPGGTPPKAAPPLPAMPPAHPRAGTERGPLPRAQTGRPLTDDDVTPIVDLTYAAQALAEPESPDADDAPLRAPAPQLSTAPDAAAMPPPFPSFRVATPIATEAEGSSPYATPYKKPRKRARTLSGHELPLQPPLEEELLAPGEAIRPRRGALLAVLVLMLLGLALFAVGLGLVGQ